jgi:hypothetical protein
LAKHVQLVLTDRSSLSAGVEFAVMSSSIWHLTDLFAKHAFLLNGLGWGGIQERTDLDAASGRRIRLTIDHRITKARVAANEHFDPRSFRAGLNPIGRRIAGCFDRPI